MWFLCASRKLASATCYAASVSDNADLKRNSAFYPQIVASDVLLPALIKTWWILFFIPDAPTESTSDRQRCSRVLRLQAALLKNTVKGRTGAPFTIPVSVWLRWLHQHEHHQLLQKVGTPAKERSWFKIRVMCQRLAGQRRKNTLTFIGRLWISDEGSKIQIFTESNCPAFFALNSLLLLHLFLFFFYILAQSAFMLFVYLSLSPPTVCCVSPRRYWADACATYRRWDLEASCWMQESCTKVESARSVTETTAEGERERDAKWKKEACVHALEWGRKCMWKRVSEGEREARESENDVMWGRRVSTRSAVSGARDWSSGNPQTRLSVPQSPGRASSSPSLATGLTPNLPNPLMTSSGVRSGHAGLRDESFV